MACNDQQHEEVTDMRGSRFTCPVMPANQAFNNAATQNCEKELKDHCHALEVDQELCKMLIASGDDKHFLSHENSILGHTGLK